MITNLTLAQRKDIYNRLQELVDIAMEHDQSIYCRSNSAIEYIHMYLNDTYNFRFVQFRPLGEYITDLPYAEQWLFALFVSEIILHGDIPE